MSNDAHPGESNTTSARHRQLARAPNRLLHRRRRHAGDALGGTEDFPGRLADRDERHGPLANLRAHRPELAPFGASSRDQDDRPVVGLQRRDHRPRGSSLSNRRRSARRLFPRSVSRRCGIGSNVAMASRSNAGGHPTASAASNAAMAFCTLCSPCSGISVARHDRHRSRIAGDGRIRQDRRRARTSSRDRGVQREPQLPRPHARCRRDASRAPGSADRPGCRRTSPSSDWLAQIRNLASRVLVHRMIAVEMIRRDVEQHRDARLERADRFELERRDLGDHPTAGADVAHLLDQRVADVPADVRRPARSRAADARSARSWSICLSFRSRRRSAPCRGGRRARSRRRPGRWPRRSGARPARSSGMPGESTAQLNLAEYRLDRAGRDEARANGARDVAIASRELGGRFFVGGVKRDAELAQHFDARAAAAPETDDQNRLAGRRIERCRSSHDGPS